MEPIEESFPRGGLQKKSADAGVKKRPREDDNLFSTHQEELDEVKKKKKKVLKEKPKIVKSKKSTIKEKSIELLNFKSLHEGMLFLGCVKEAKDFELVVSLPYGLTGYVQAINICEAYTKLLNEQVKKDDPVEALSPLSDLYSPGMLVRCAVSNLETTLGGFHSIKLSLNPKLVNSDLTPSSLQSGMFLCGFVASIEDHGYLIDLGVGGAKAFLPRQKAQVYLEQTSKATSLRVGQYLNCVIDDVKNGGRIVRLSITQSDVAAAIATEEQKWTLNNILPGVIVKAQIQKVFSDHVKLSFLSSYTGIVDFLHFESKKANSYKEDQTLKACVLWVDRSTKTIRLTLRKSFLQPGSSVRQLSSDWIGTLHERCTVKALHKNTGAVFQLDGETLGFASKKTLGLSKSTTLDKMKAGTVHKGRVVGFSPMDEILLLSFKEDVIEGEYLRLEDVQVGQILKGTVNSITPKGMVVDITKHINGLVPKLHLADVTLHNPEKKYTPGAKIKCRVLSVDPSAKKLILTRKKIMINSTLPILTTYHDAAVGLVTHGFIWSMKPSGCIVKFYNDVQGLAPIRELSSEYIASPEDIFCRGQVVKAKVIECDPEKKSLILSFKSIGEEEQPTHVKKNTAVYEYGKIVDVKIVSKVEDGLNVLILPEENPGFLPKIHLSDHVANCEFLWHSLKDGDQLPGVMSLSTFKGRTTLTRKPAFISFVEKETPVKEISEVEPQMVFTGFVKNIMPYGIFVALPYGLVGLVPKQEIGDKFVTNIEDHFVVGQTVVAKVTSVDVEKKRFLLTLKMSECAPKDLSAKSFSRLSQCFTEVQLSRSLLGRDENLEDGENLYSVLPGKKLTLVVEEVEENGSVLFGVGKISGAQRISAIAQDKAKSLVAGEKAKVVVLHVDLLKSHVHVSLDNTLLKTKGTVVEDETHTAVVQHVAEEFAIVSLEATSHLAAMPLSCHYNDSFRFDSEKLHLGQKISVTIKKASADEYGLLLAVEKGNKRQKQPSKATAERVTGKPMIGELVTGTVKSVKPTSVIVSVADDKQVGVIHVSNILENVAAGVSPTSTLKANQTVTCRVIGGRDVKTHKFLPITHPHLMKSILELSILPSLIDPSNSDPELQLTKKYLPGDKVTCYVTKYNKEKKCLEVEITSDIHGQIDLLFLSMSIKVLHLPEKHFKPGQALSATVLGTSHSIKTLSLSLIGNFDLKEGALTFGYVKSINPGSGLEISLPFGNTGKASLFHLSDCLADSSVKKFTIGMIVRCYVLSIGKTVEVSLRRSRTSSESTDNVKPEEISSITSLKEGQMVEGFVGAITNKGIFFRLSSSIVGRIQFSHTTCYFVEDFSAYSSYIPEGTLLTAKILSIDQKANHVELSLLSKDTGKPDIIPKSAGLPLRSKVCLKRKRTTSESEPQVGTKKKKLPGSKDDEDSGVEVHCQENEKEHKKPSSPAVSKAPAPRLQVSSGFSWDVNLNTLKTSVVGGNESSSDSEDDDDDEEEEEEKTKAKKPKNDQPKSQSKETSDPNQQPQSVNEFERLVITSPNISANWIQYMDFHLQATELEQARAVAERALQTIYFREEQEKLNVWAAMLRMENTFGTEETLQKVFERAVQYNDPLKAFEHLVDIYIKSEKFKEAEELYNAMVKRFRQEKSVWWKYATFLLKQGQTDSTHRLLQRALKCVPEKEHVDLISKFAQLEFRMGDAVRAKALFESTLSSYPKRTDLWSVYIDMMVKHGSQKEVRDIFERVIHLSLAPKRIKFFFKRYLEYEKKHGTEKTVQAVKEKALKYVESKGSMATT
ncbi:protein RRP5 homolog [Leptodactylus fuscus]|uniref:protein RRP5 homolog n=1 Tax=Leptodactylus fuscus TaxID=238119 RepID=UPI003F4F3099